MKTTFAIILLLVLCSSFVYAQDCDPLQVGEERLLNPIQINNSIDSDRDLDKHTYVLLIYSSNIWSSELDEKSLEQWNAPKKSSYTSYILSN